MMNSYDNEEVLTCQDCRKLSEGIWSLRSLMKHEQDYKLHRGYHYTETYRVRKVCEACNRKRVAKQLLEGKRENNEDDEGTT